MKRLLFIISTIIFTISGLSQEVNQVITDEKTGNEILVGAIDIQGMHSCEEFMENFKVLYSEYQPDNAVIEQITGKLEGVDITIVLATWCHDSKIQVPYFFRILTLTGYNENSLNLIGVDRVKKAGALNIRKMKIKRVPTFIFYKDGKELGRIVETPKTTLESDMLEILGD